MIEIEEIADAVMERWGQGRPLTGKQVLISSGPTEEPIDPVRVITNRSTGKMGAALAAEALRLGAQVTVVTGPAVTPLPAGVDVVSVRTAAEMEVALNERFPFTDICIMAAAVSDYHPVKVADSKLERKAGGTMTIELTANNDIIAGLGSRKKKQILVGFALESTDDIERVKRKLKRKNCDLMVYNRVDTSLAVDTTEIIIIDRQGKSRKTSMLSKDAAATIIFDRIGEITGDTNG